jgi:hypothetical protein
MRMLLAPVALAAVLTLAGCAPGPAASDSTSPPPSSSPVASSPAATPIAEPTEGSDAGCPANEVPVPADATPVTIQDVDGDGRADAQFYSEDELAYGIRTASGATILLDDDLAGPGEHHGWTSIRETATVTVLDDGRSATLHAFLDCGFVTTTDEDGTPYRFGLNGFSDYGTGVECTNDNGGALLAGVLAARQSDGSYDIEGTVVSLVDGGRTAENGAKWQIAEGLDPDDDQVKLAMRSTCGDVPIVGSSGR